MQDEGRQWSGRERKRHRLTTYKFAMIILALTLIMFAVAIALDPKGRSIGEIADSELESLFAPAAGGEARKSVSQEAEKFSLRRRHR